MLKNRPIFPFPSVSKASIPSLPLAWAMRVSWTVLSWRPVSNDSASTTASAGVSLLFTATTWTPRPSPWWRDTISG